MDTELLITNMEKAIVNMREALEDPKGYGILLQYSNYEFNCGMYYAYLDIYSEVEARPGKYAEFCEKHSPVLEELAEAADKRYVALKLMDRRNSNV